MKKQNLTFRTGNYVSPRCEILPVETEGVLCQSQVSIYGGINEAGRDVEEDVYSDIF